MIPYQFADGATIDLENLIAVEEICYIGASRNPHSDYIFGEHYYDLVFKFATNKVRRYALWNAKRSFFERGDLITERDQLIVDWKSGVSRCLVKEQNA